LFRESATKFLQENQHKRSIECEARQLKFLDGFIGDIPLEAIHRGTLQAYIIARRKEGVKARTINYGLQLVRHILNLGANEWMDEHGLTWVSAAPKIKLLSENDARKPYPLDWNEQDQLFDKLPLHLKEMSLFAANTGCRDQEVCKLRWAWEVKTFVPEIGSVFIIPGENVKNGEDRLVVLNQIAKAVIERQRGKHPTTVFTYQGKPITRMLNNGWRTARVKAGLMGVRVHDLKRTFGRRLRAAAVSFEDRQDLLGHKSARITTHYSVAELLNLWEAANKVCEEARPRLELLRTSALPSRAKVAQGLL
jgi:integrase